MTPEKRKIHRDKLRKAYDDHKQTIRAQISKLRKETYNPSRMKRDTSEGRKKWELENKKAKQRI
jgi:hypothetical protein